MQQSQLHIDRVASASWKPRTTRDRFENALIFTQYLKALSEKDTDNPALQALLESVDTYAQQLCRIICCIPADAKDKQDMKDGSVRVAEQIREILEDENPALADWSYGCNPSNVPKIVMNILTDALHTYQLQ
jgi:hypothetical protein